MLSRVLEIRVVIIIIVLVAAMLTRDGMGEACVSTARCGAVRHNDRDDDDDDDAAVVVVVVVT